MSVYLKPGDKIVLAVPVGNKSSAAEWKRAFETMNVTVHAYVEIVGAIQPAIIAVFHAEDYPNYGPVSQWRCWT